MYSQMRLSGWHGKKPQAGLLLICSVAFRLGSRGNEPGCRVRSVGPSRAADMRKLDRIRLLTRKRVERAISR